MAEIAAQEIAEEVVANYHAALNRWQGLRERQNIIQALINGWWQTVFPDDVSDVDLPQVANAFRLVTEDGGHLFAEVGPTERVFPSKGTGEDAAEKRERIVSSYTERSRILDRLEYHGMDMIAAGYTVIKTWPDMDCPPADRFPRFSRLHPLSVLPEVLFKPDAPTDNVCVHYPETLNRLAKEFPAQMAGMLEEISKKTNPAAYGYDISRLVEIGREPKVLMVLDWYSSKYIARVALYSADGQQASQLLAYDDNVTGICPVQIAYRPTWASEPLGQLDDSKGIVLTKNRSIRLLVDYFIEMVYGGKLAWNVQNPHERGPGTVYRALGPDAKMEPVTPNAPSFAALNLVNEIEQEGRAGMVSPASREGDVALSRTSTSTLTRSQGQLNSVVKSLQRNFGIAKHNANEAAFAQDEAWCNTSKRIFGIARGRRFEDTYTPSDDIAGDHGNVVTYGPLSGLDLPTHMVLWENMRATRSVSLETFLENNPNVPDVPEELARIRGETLEDAFVLGLSDPSVPIEQRGAALKAFKEGKTVEEVVDILAAARAATPTMASIIGGGGGGAPNPLAQPGVPGAQGPAIPPLPPLQTLRRPPIVPGSTVSPNAPKFVRG